MTRESETGKSLWLFFLLTYGFSWAFWIPQALAANGVALPGWIAGFLDGPFNPAAFGPLVAALVLVYSREGRRGVAGWLRRGLEFRFRKIWLLPILLLPPLIFRGGVLLSVLTGATPPDTSVLSNPIVALVAPVIILLTGLWHLPLVFIPGKFMVNSPALFGALLVEMVLITILFTWIYNNTGGSVLATMLFHTSMNWSIWVVLPDMQVNVSIVGFTIMLLAVAVSVVAGLWEPASLRRGSH